MKSKIQTGRWFYSWSSKPVLLCLLLMFVVAGLSSCASSRAINCPDTSSAQIIGVDKNGRATRESKKSRKTKDGLLKKNKSQKKARR